MTIGMDAGSSLVDAVDVRIAFDPVYLQVVDDGCSAPISQITPGTAFPTVLQNTVDNASGLIRFSAGQALATSSSVTTTATIATFTFKGITVTPLGGSLVSFATGTGAYYGGTSLLFTVQSATVEVTGSGLLGQVTLQGRGDPPSSRWTGYPLRITFQPGAGLPFTATTTTDAAGIFSSMSAPGAIYALVCVKNPHALSLHQVSVDLTTIPATLIPFDLLREGDANDDDTVFGVDVSILATAYGTCAGDTLFDDCADFNGDGCINGADYSLLATNYHLSGTCPLISHTLALNNQPGAGPVVIALDPLQQTAATGAVVPMAVRVRAGEQAVDNVDIELTFDPAQLQVVDAAGQPVTALMASATLPQVLWNRVDNGVGNVLFSAARSFAGEAPRGEFTLAEFYVKVLAASPAAVALAPGALTGAYANGASVLDHAEGAMVVVEGSSPAPRFWLPLLLRHQ
jgi:hypothetical protein